MNIYAYKAGSVSAKDLANSLGCLRIKHKDSRFRGRGNKTVINWGASELPAEVTKCRIINDPRAVAVASNKLSFMIAMSEQEDFDVNIPEFTTDREVAEMWVEEGTAVMCRRLLNANSGRGIVYADAADKIVDAPLYTKYMKKAEEFRIHVYDNTVIDCQRKARRREVPDANVNWKIRNLEGGFIYARTDIQVPDAVLTQAISSVNACKLDFGAVDVIYNARRQEATVLEVNTAPGLVGTTLEKYTEAFQNL